MINEDRYTIIELIGLLIEIGSMIFIFNTNQKWIYTIWILGFIIWLTGFIFEQDRVRSNKKGDKNERRNNKK